MNKLFEILDGYIKNTGDITKDRAAVEAALRDLDSIEAYAEAGGDDISRADASRISDAGLQWIAAVNDGNGEWGRMRHETAALLA